ncbi:thioredoxin family protein [Ulvibacter sp. MAR_2010_11]|uniref:thioredoxin family protein n=1 Tax=Ulvibacter sp. MAR_2010_11 TaxID=1250229 RepID=UPI0012FE254D|nr:thioredoxin family protein [Ulvibacter sp. MAR_2010_11]
MKKLLLAFLFPVMSFAQGINFEDATFPQLLAKAKTENKIIFIHAYTLWNSSSKYMKDKVFPDANVGAYFNSNFINARFNMEEGEGIMLVKDYNITDYPTILFIDGNGKLVLKTLGFQSQGELIALGKSVAKPIDFSALDNMDLGSFSFVYTEEELSKRIEEFDSGNRDPKFLYKLTEYALNRNHKNAKMYARAFYKVEKNLLTYDNATLMLQTMDSPESEEFTFLQRNEAEVSKIHNHIDVTNKLDKVVSEFALIGIDENESITNRVNKIESTIAKYRPNKAIELSSFYGLAYAEQEKDFKLYEKYALIYFEITYKNSRHNLLNKVAWGFYENITNEASLEKALKWALQSVDVSSNSYNNDTVAHLYYKLGDTNNARIYAEIAIKLGKENGADTSITEALLAKLN